MKNQNNTPNYKESFQQEIHNVSREAFAVYAQLQTVFLALYHVQDEPDPVSHAVTISFVVEDAAKRLEKLHEKLTNMEE